LINNSNKRRSKTIKFLFFLVVLSLGVLLIRYWLGWAEQKQSILLRMGNDEEIRLLSKRISLGEEISVLQHFTWYYRNTDKLFTTYYGYYYKCSSVAIASAVNRDEAIIPYLKEAIQKFIELPDIHREYVRRYDPPRLFDIFVWSLLYIDGKSGFIWLEKTLNSNSNFPIELKNTIKTNAQCLLWIGENEIHDVPDFISKIQIEIYDREWVIRFYCEYCKFYNISNFNNFDEWYEHYQQRRVTMFSSSSYKENAFLHSWSILYNLLNRNNSACTIRTSISMSLTTITIENRRHGD
jgi:hypothetical protein